MAYDKTSFLLGLAAGLATRGVIDRPAFGREISEDGFGYAGWTFDEATRTLSLIQIDTSHSYPFSYTFDTEAFEGYVDDTDPIA